MNEMRPGRRKAATRAGLAAAIFGAAVAGFASATFIFAEKDIGERAPIGAVRGLAGRDRGRDAIGPQDFPPLGWWEIVRRTSLLAARNRLMSEAAAVTFYSLLALFPALTAVVSLYGLFADPAAIAGLLDAVSDVVPAGGVDLLRAQIKQLVEHGSRGLSIGAGIGLAAALWSANQGSKALFDSLNVVYREPEKRPYPLFVLQAFAFTLGAIIFVIAAMVGVVLLPEILRRVGLSDFTQVLLKWLRWPVILLFVSGFLAALYRFGPSRENPKWRWVTWGSGLASLSWVAVSFAFSWYVHLFGSFDRTYGSLGAVVAFMFWMWLSTLVALIGAQLNSEMEHQTAEDTTTGTPMPLGLRGATQADTVA